MSHDRLVDLTDIEEASIPGVPSDTLLAKGAGGAVVSGSVSVTSALAAVAASHSQNTDLYLDFGGPNEVTAEQLSAVTAVTVAPSGSDYTSINAALAAGHTNVLVRGSVASSQITVPAGTAPIQITIQDGVTVTFGANNGFSYGSARDVYLFGFGSAEIVYQMTIPTSIFFNNSAFPASRVFTNGLNFTNNSNAIDTAFTAGPVFVQNCVYNLPNISGTFGPPLGNADFGFFENVTFVGGGSSCENIFQVSGGGEYGNFRVLKCNFLGQYSAGNPMFNLQSSSAVMRTIRIEHTTNASSIFFGSDVIADDILVLGSQNLTVDVSNDAKVSRIRPDGLYGGSMTLDMSSDGIFTGALVSDSYFHTLGVTSPAVLRGCTIENAKATNADDCRYTDCNFNGGFTVDDTAGGGQRNIFTNCRFGANPAGAPVGAETLTLDAGTAGNQYYGSTGDGTLSDAGTNNGTYSEY